MHTLTHAHAQLKGWAATSCALLGQSTCCTRRTNRKWRNMQDHENKSDDERRQSVDMLKWAREIRSHVVPRSSLVFINCFFENVRQGRHWKKMQPKHENGIWARISKGLSIQVQPRKCTWWTSLSRNPWCLRCSSWSHIVGFTLWFSPWDSFA